MSSKNLPMTNVTVKNIFPKRRQDLLKESGWGYRDSYLYFDKVKNTLMFHGKRYSGVGTKPLGNALEGFKSIYSVDLSQNHQAVAKKPSPNDYPLTDNSEFRLKLKNLNIDHSTDFEDRFYRGHSQASTDIFISLYGKFDKIPDLIVWPKNHSEVVEIVKLANELNIGIIPFGGGSNVTSATQCPSRENRMICSLDTTQMCRMLWLDEKSMIACFETGISGQDLERVLNERGYTMGHSPDSIEFSTLGGWIATKSAGMKQQIYGNIEDIVVKMKFVTSIGVLEHDCTTPRASTGPDFEKLIIGSEGTLGIITEAVVKLHKLPKCEKYASILFPDISHGIKFLNECSKNDWLPSNLRLFCNTNVKTGMILEETGSLSGVKNKIQMMFIKNWLRFDENLFTIASYMLEGDEKSVGWKDKALRAIAGKFNGYFVGENVAKLSYVSSSTYSVYLRDILFSCGLLADTVETSVIWSKLENCIENVTTKYKTELTRRNLSGYILYRISQVYREGVCLYLYYGLNKCNDQLKTFKNLTNYVKSVIKECGGSLSHHHGIGIKNSTRYHETMPEIKKQMLRVLKMNIDPKNVFCVRNFLPEIEAKL